jgi:hypothetical protein
MVEQGYRTFKSAWKIVHVGGEPRNFRKEPPFETAEYKERFYKAKLTGLPKGATDLQGLFWGDNRCLGL